MLGCLAQRAGWGSVVETEDRDGWFDAAGPVTTIGFTEFPDGTYITDQYADNGVTFVDGDDLITCCSKVTFPIDGAGLDGNAAIHLLFATPQRWIAADFPGVVQFELLSEGLSVYESGGFANGGTGNFGGLLSTTPFDEAIVLDPWDTQVNLDDLHFGGLPVGDLDGDGAIGVSDFLSLLGAWGPCPQPCPKVCLGDLDGDDTVGVDDFLALLAAWGPHPGHPADLDFDGEVGILDFLAQLGAWGPCPVLWPPTCPEDLDEDCTVGVNDFLLLLANWTGSEFEW
jgi:hypothetical protein